MSTTWGHVLAQVLTSTAQPYSASNNPPGSAIGPYMGLNNYANLAFSGFDTYLAGDPQNPTYPHSDTSYQYQYFNYGTWSITDDRDLRVAPGANAIFGNYGIFQKSGGSGTTTVDIDFFNSGHSMVGAARLTLGRMQRLVFQATPMRSWARFQTAGLRQSVRASH